MFVWRLSGEAGDGTQLEAAATWKVPSCSGGAGWHSRCHFGGTADGRYIAAVRLGGWPVHGRHCSVFSGSQCVLDRRARWCVQGNSKGDCYVFDSESGERVAHVSAIRVSGGRCSCRAGARGGGRPTTPPLRCACGCSPGASVRAVRRLPPPAGGARQGLHLPVSRQRSAAAGPGVCPLTRRVQRPRAALGQPAASRRRGPAGLSTWARWRLSRARRAASTRARRTPTASSSEAPPVRLSPRRLALAYTLWVAL